MTERVLDDLDPVLAAAYAAERSVTADAIAAVAINRDRLMFAVCERVLANPPPAARPSRATRARWAIAGIALLAVSIGYAMGRITAPGFTPAEPARGDAAISVPVDARPPDVAPAPAPQDAAPSIADAAAAKPPPVRVTPDNAESLVLDRARAALRRHLPADALTALEGHQRTFPNGQLREERDVLLIEVALQQHRLADANEQIAHYLDQYPRGSLRSRVDELRNQLDQLISHGH